MSSEFEGKLLRHLDKIRSLPVPRDPDEVKREIAEREAAICRSVHMQALLQVKEAAEILKRHNVDPIPVLDSTPSCRTFCWPIETQFAIDARNPSVILQGHSLFVPDSLTGKYATLVNALGVRGHFLPVFVPLDFTARTPPPFDWDLIREKPIIRDASSEINDDIGDFTARCVAELISYRHVYLQRLRLKVSGFFYNAR